MIETFNFLPIILTYIGLLSLAILTVNIPKHGKIIGHYLNLLATVSVLFLVDSTKEYQLTELFVVGNLKLEFVQIIGIFNIIMAILNGSNTFAAVKSSLLISFMYLGSIFFIGSTDFIGFFVSIELMSLMGYVLVALANKEWSKEAAVKYFIQGSIMTAILLLGMAFFFVSTKSMSFLDITVYNHELYGISLVLMLIVTCFKIGAFPFHSWMPDVYANVDKGNLASNFLMTKLVIGFGMISLLQKLLGEADPNFQSIFLKCLLGISIISALYGNLMGLAQKQFKRIIAYSSVAHSGYMLMTICLIGSDGYESQLMFYLVFYSVAATGALLLINNFVDASGEQDTYESLKGGFYKYGLSGFGLCLFVLSLAGMPLTSGFTTKYLLFANYFKEGFTVEALAVLITSVIGLVYYIKFVVVLFIENNNTVKETSIVELGNLRSQIILFLFAIMVLVGGIAPSVFLK